MSRENKITPPLLANFCFSQSQIFRAVVLEVGPLPSLVPNPESSPCCPYQIHQHLLEYEKKKTIEAGLD